MHILQYMFALAQALTLMCQVTILSDSALAIALAHLYKGDAVALTFIMGQQVNALKSFRPTGPTPDLVCISGGIDACS